MYERKMEKVEHATIHEQDNVATNMDRQNLSNNPYLKLSPLLASVARQI